MFCEEEPKVPEEPKQTPAEKPKEPSPEESKDISEKEAKGSPGESSDDG